MLSIFNAYLLMNKEFTQAKDTSTGLDSGGTFVWK